MLRSHATEQARLRVFGRTTNSMRAAACCSLRRAACWLLSVPQAWLELWAEQGAQDSRPGPIMVAGLLDVELVCNSVSMQQPFMGHRSSLDCPI